MKRLLMTGLLIVVFGAMATAQEAPTARRNFEVDWDVVSWARQGDDYSGLGGVLSFAGYLSPEFALVGTIGAHRDAVIEPTLFLEVDVDLITYQFGPRFRHTVNERASVFVEGLVGGFTAEASALGITIDETGFAAYGGAGVDIGIRPWFHIRPVNVGYQYLNSDDLGGSNGVRVGGGVVFRFGT